MCIVVLLVAVLLVACGPTAMPIGPRAASPEVPIPLAGTEWILISLHDDSLVACSSIALNFYPENYLEGHAGCNSYGADYVSSGNEFRVSVIHKTELDCDVPESVMQQEAAYFEALVNVAACRGSDDRLEFDDATGKTILGFARKLPPSIDLALKDSEWVLTFLNDESPLEGSRITLNFEEERVDGYAGCNDYGGEIEVADGGSLTISEIFITAVACRTSALEDQEWAYIEALSNGAAYRVMNDRLEIDDAASKMTLAFSRRPQFSVAPDDLLGTVWQLVSVDGDSLIEGSIITLAFHNAYRLSGHAGCRDYIAAYEADGDDLEMFEGMMIDADCPMQDALLEQEGRFMGILGAKSDYQLSGGRLEVLADHGGVLLFEPLPEDDIASLEGTVWTLMGLLEEKVVQETPVPHLVPYWLAGTGITATLEGGLVSGSTGCNTYGTSYTADGLSIAFEVVTVTETECEASIMARERRYLEVLQDVTAYRVWGDHLWLEANDGWVLVFAASAQQG